MAKHIVNSDLEVKGSLSLSGANSAFVKGDGSLDNRSFLERETLTSIEKPSLEGNILTIKYKGEDKLLQQQQIDLSTLLTRDNTLSNATYDASSNTIVLTASDGSNTKEYRINLSEFQVFFNTNSDGTISAVQEGVEKYRFATIANTGNWYDVRFKPTTRDGYGITDVYKKDETNTSAEIDNKDNEVKKYAAGLISGLKVGGRNCLRNSDFSKDLTQWGTAGSGTFAVNDGGVDLIYSEGQLGGINQSVDLNGYEGELTISFEARSLGNGWATPLFFGIEGVATVSNIGIDDSLEWKKFSFTVKAPKMKKETFILYASANMYYAIKVRNIKLEKGAVATDWTPSLEDVSQDIADALTEAKKYTDNAKSKTFSTVFGDGNSTSFDIQHNLNTDVVCTVLDTTSNFVVFGETLILDSNSVRVSFATPPKSNSYKIIIK